MAGSSTLVEDASSSFCSLCGGNKHKNIPLSSSSSVLLLDDDLRITNTPQFLMVNYKCPSCSMRVGEVFSLEGEIRGVKQILEGVVKDLITKIKEFKKNKGPSSVEVSDKGRKKKMSSSSKKEKDKMLKHPVVEEVQAYEDNNNCDDLALDGGGPVPEDLQDPPSPYTIKILERRKKMKTHLRCSQCPDLSFKTEGVLNRHRITAHQMGEGPYLCQYCSKGFITKNSLRIHDNITHSEVKRVCPHEGCGKEFRNLLYLNAHVKLHAEGIESLKCPLCPKDFDNYRSFNAHKRFHGDKFRCIHDGCGRAFAVPSLLKAHMMKIHSDERPFLCEKCGKTFKTNDVKSSHMKTVHRDRGELSEPEYPWKCPHCPNASFKIKEGLDRHLCSCHGNEWPFPCDHFPCGKGFINETELRDHKDTCHSVGVQVCPVEGCGKQFANLRLLKLHEELHENGIESLKCEKCEKEFDNYRTFNAHRKHHRRSENKRFSCPSCPKMFAIQADLKKHMASHKGVRKYRCTTCQRLFYTTSHLKSHYKSVHEKGGKPRPRMMGPLEKMVNQEK